MTIYSVLCTKQDIKIGKVNFCVVTTIMIIFKSPQLIILKVTGPSSPLRFYNFVVSSADCIEQVL